MKKGILIGAGFSYDLGMPLGRDFTQMLFSLLNKSKVYDLISKMKQENPYGSDHPLDKDFFDVIFEEYIRFNNSPQRDNYEFFLSKVESIPCRDHSQSRTRDFFLSNIHSIINRLFWVSQKCTYPIYKEGRQFYNWFLENHSDNELWVLSLNHDINIEMLCIDNSIPFSFGGDSEISFPISNVDRKSEILFDMVDNKKKNINELNFFEGSGVNLIKLHGGVNEFFFSDEKSRLNISSKLVKNSWEYLLEVEKVLYGMHYMIGEKRVDISDEIVISDNDGVMQFLKPSILSGGNKYSETINLKEKEEKMELFSQVLQNLDELTIIGYSYADKHINHRIQQAMYTNKKLKLVFVDPCLDKNPELFRAFDYNLRLRLAKVTCTIWFDYLKHSHWNTEIGDEMKKIDKKRRLIFDYLKKQV